MKTRFMSLLLVTIMAVAGMTGCRAARTAEAAGSPVAQGAESVAETWKQVVDADTTAPGKHTNPALTSEEARSIALKHAGFAADQVAALRTEYEIEHGLPQYDVEFRHGFWEYDYEIHADTGEILSYSKDD